MDLMVYKDMFFFEWAKKIEKKKKEKRKKNTKFKIKIIKKGRKIQKMILFIVEISPEGSNQKIWSEKW